jgi:glycosyltransferase involved in cell wall biosynthesis
LICLRKNQNAFIQALDPLARARPFKLVFLGQAIPGRQYDDEFLALVKARPWCAHAGFAGRETLKQHLREASLLALPSLEDNCPMVVLEAQAAGVPVVAAKVGGLPDLVEEGETGFFCDPLNGASMCGAVEKALANPEAARALALRTKERARQRFNPETIARRHLEIYSEVLAGRSRSGA